MMKLTLYDVADAGDHGDDELSETGESAHTHTHTHTSIV
jgi:hypothetical protein